MAERDLITSVALAGEADEIVLPLSQSQYSAVRYRARAIESIRRHAVDKFMSIPRGGLEVGGLLLGRVEGDTIEILDSEEFVVEYASGPAYRFTPADKDKLREKLQGSNQVIGWWHSHTRSEIDLSDEDLALHREFFAQPHSLALILKPFKFDPAQAALYLPNSSSDAFAACARFSLEGPKARLPREASPAPVVLPLVRRPQPVALTRAGRRRRALAAVATVVGLLCAISWFLTPSRTPPPEALGLSLFESGNQLTVRWDRKADAIQSSVGGELIVVDGQHITRIPLGVDSLNGGTLAYVRRSGNVEVRLRARSRDNELHESVAHFAGPPPQSETKPEPITVERHETRETRDVNVDRMRAEVERLNNELARMRTVRKPPATGPTPTLSPAPMKTAVNTPVAQTIAALPPSISVTPSTNANAPAALPPVAAPPPPSAQATPQPTKPATPSRGRAIWTGMLPRGAVLAFDGPRPSSGAVTGRLPDGPSRVRVYPGDLREAGIVVYTQGDRERIETPSAANGWNLTTYKPDSKRSRDVAVLETPNPANNWKRILVRSEQRPISILVLEWEEVAR